MKRRTEESMIFAVEFTPEYFSADLLDLVRELPNVEEIQLQGCDVSDDDLKKLATLNRLEGIGLNETSITHQGLQHLSEIKGLKFIQYNGVIYGSIEEIIEKKNE